MEQRHRSLVFAALLAPALAGCGTVYQPRPSPRIAAVPEGSSFTLHKNGKGYPVGVLGGDLDEVVAGNPRAEAEVKSFQAKSIAGFTLGILGSVATGVGTGVVVGNELSASPSDTPRIAGLSLVAGGVVFALVGSLIQAGAQKHMWNAINIYNDDLPPPWGFGAPRAPAPYGAPGYPATPTAGPLAPYSTPGAPPAYAPPAYSPPPPSVAPPSVAPPSAPPPNLPR